MNGPIGVGGILIVLGLLATMESVLDKDLAGRPVKVLGARAHRRRSDSGRCGTRRMVALNETQGPAEASWPLERSGAGDLAILIRCREVRRQRGGWWGGIVARAVPRRG